MQIENRMTRFLVPLMAAFVFAFAVFWGLYALIHRGVHGMDDMETLQTIDFVRLKRVTELEIKQRKKPEKPPPPKQPPPPQLKVASNSKPDMAPTHFNLPNLNLATNVSGGPFLGNFSAGENVGTGDGEMIPLVRIAPQYPRQALRDGIDGEVTLEITIGPDGSVTSVRVKRAKPRGYFESAAVAAAYKGRFKPKVVDGKPVETTGVYTVKFSMEGG